MTATALSPTTAAMPGPKPQELEAIHGRYPKGTLARIARVLGEKPAIGAQADLLRTALDRELTRREREAKRKP